MIEFFYDGKIYNGSYSDEGVLEVLPISIDALLYLKSIGNELNDYFPTMNWRLKKIADKVGGTFTGDLSYEYEEGVVY